MAGWLARLAGPCLQQMSQNLASSTHMDRTANLERSEISSDAIVTDIFQLSPTVKRFQLQVLNKHVTFKAGQWVDVTIPSVSIVGGYSMCSTPLTLQTEGVLELAVKYSDHPPAKWMHSHVSFFCLCFPLVLQNQTTPIHCYRKGRGVALWCPLVLQRQTTPIHCCKNGRRVGLWWSTSLAEPDHSHPFFCMK
jgi:hypothetical protein